MASSAFSKKSQKGSADKESRILVEAYQRVLEESGIVAVFTEGCVSSTSDRGVDLYLGSLGLKWAKVDEKHKRLETDAFSVNVNGRVIRDTDNPKLHRMRLSALAGALDDARNEILRVATEPTGLYKEAVLCLKRFYPFRQAPVECLKILGNKAFTGHKCYIRAKFESTEIDLDLMPKYKKNKPTQAVKIILLVAKDTVVIAGPIFKTMKSYGTTKMPEEQTAKAEQLVRNPMVSPTDVYNAILATAFIQKPTDPIAALAVQCVLSLARL